MEADQPALLLTVLPTHELWVWTLTDGAGLARVVSGTPALAQAEALSHRLELGAGGPAEAARLAQLLLPGDVGAWLAQAPPGALVLQLHPTLDRMAWEQAWVGRAPLGQRFAVTRQPVLDEDPSSRPRPAVAGTAALRVLRVLPAGSVAPAADAAEAGDGYTGDTRIGASADAAAWSTHDVVLLPQADCDGWARLATPRRPAALVVATVADPASALAAACAVVRQGSTLLLARCDGGAPMPAWWPALLRQLDDGLDPGAAVRQLRRDHAAARPAPVLRLFGAAHQPLRRAGDLRAAAQRRQVTALSVDLVESTRTLQTLGAERYSTLLQSFHDLCADVMHRHGGVADDPQGDDGLMAYFGYPVAAEDAAARAVDAALALVQAVVDLGLAVRVGVATGLVAIQNDTPVGVSIHLAARLQKRAEPGMVVLADSTRALLGAAFELQRLHGPIELKGIAEAQSAWQALGRSHEGTHTFGAGGHRALPLVGREAELDTLWAHWQRARQGQLQLVVVQGDAGIGKSRLLREMRARLAQQGVESTPCRCRPEARHSAFFALGTTLRRMLAVDESASPAVQLAQVAEGLPAVLPRDEALPLVAALLGLPLAAPAPERWRERTLGLLLRWFTWSASRGPVCLLVEDTHWIDPSTAEFLHRLVQRSQELPILLLATRRSDVEPGWEPAVAHHKLALRGLAPSAARWLIRQACGAKPLPAAVVRLLAAKADGVPLFLEESVRMAQELHAADHSTREQLAAHVPATLRDLLMARIDRLAEAKRTAQLAATLGRSFPWGLLQAVAAREFGDVATASLPARVHSLEHAGLLLRHGEGEHAHYSFRHALLRDTAYQSLFNSDRHRVHQVVAEVLTARFDHLVQRQPELLAYHLAEAGQHAGALAQWETAARLAVERSANDEAIAHLEAALAALSRLPAGPEQDRIELRLQTLLAARCIAAEGYGAERVERVYGRASALCLQLADHRTQLKVELGLHAWHFMRADFTRAHQIAQRALAAAAEAAASPMARIQARWSVGVTLWHQGQLPQAERLMDECLQDYRPDMHRPGAVQDPGVMCACYSAWALWELGRPDAALERLATALALAEQLAHRFSQGLVLGFASSVHHFRGSNTTALDYAERAIVVCEEGGYTTWLAHARMMRGRLQCALGRVDEGVAEMQEAYAAWVDSGAHVTRPFYLAMQAEGLAAGERTDEALQLLQDALALADRTGERYHEAEIRRLLGELTALLAGDAGLASARRWLGSAAQLAAAQGKRSFVLRAALGLARLGGATAPLRSALAPIEGGADTADVLAARAWLAARQAGDAARTRGAP
jgi:class 3 adenylate cyclase/tetratricopeptide (TPR) repeat protein